VCYSLLAENGQPLFNTTLQATALAGVERAGDYEADETPIAVLVDNRTAAEKRFEQQSAKTEEKRVRDLASQTHRDKVKHFNEYLTSLSEHNDIPKVGPG
jgi:protein FAM32A